MHVQACGDSDPCGASDPHGASDPCGASDPHGASDPAAWSAHDVANHFGRSVSWAWRALARWRAAGAVTTVDVDAVTGAVRYAKSQVLEAYQAEQAYRAEQAAEA